MGTLGDLASARELDLQQSDMSLKSAEGALPISAIENDDNPVEEAFKATEKNPIDFDFHFPEEVWEIILDNLTEDDDRTNCCRAIQLFDRILTKSKPIWMFKQILPLMPGGWADMETGLTCRRVCKQWCEDIDHDILADANGWYKTCGVDMDDWYLFDSEEKLDSFAHIFEGHSGNPFISRSVGIENYLRDDVMAYGSPDKFLELLFSYGEHVWTLNFHWEDPVVEAFEGFYQRFDWADSYEFLQQALKKTPNLKKLNIWGRADVIEFDLDGAMNENSFLLTQRELPLPLTPTTPLPSIPTLETLDIENFIGSEFFPDSFIKMLILTYGANLKDISVDEGILGQILPRQMQLPKLASLKVREVSSDEDLKKLCLLTAPLKKLQIYSPQWYLGSASSTINLSTSLDVFHNFQLLAEVGIYGCSVETQDLSYLNNLTVKKLTLNNIGGNGVPASFNFLQVFDTLENLFVCLKSSKEIYLGRNEGEGELQLYKMLETDQLYESNIWSLIPSLEEVFIFNDDSLWTSVYGNRDAFEEYQASWLQAYSPIEKEQIEVDFHFPKEVWEVILDNLTEDDDLTNCCRAFPLFDRLLTKRKPVWMFKQIFPLLPWGWADQESIWNCRRVCKQWRENIDHGIITNPLFWGQTCNLFGGVEEPDMYDWYLFDCEKKIDSFTKTFGGHSFNPFITRRVGIKNYLHCDGLAAFETPPKFLEFLSNYGEHVWTLDFYSDDRVEGDFQGLHQRFDRLQSYDFLKQVLTSTPNLRTLNMWGKSDTRSFDFDGTSDEYNFCRALMETPIPFIPTLDTLVIRNFDSMIFFPDSFTKMLILAYGPNLKELTIDSKPVGEMLPQQLQLPKLTSFEVVGALSDKDLVKLRLLTAPLKTLEIVGFYSCTEASSPLFINLSTLLDVLHSFQLLENVRIRNYFVETQVDVSHRINSSVRKLTLENIGDNIGSPTSFNFLQVFEALEELSVVLEHRKHAYFRMNEGEGELQFYKMLKTDQLYESNIWNLIPSLKTVYISYHEGSVWGEREGFEKYQSIRVKRD